MKRLVPSNPPDYLGLMWDIRTGYMERGEVAQSGYWSVRTVRLTNPEEAVLPTIGEAGYAAEPDRRRLAHENHDRCTQLWH